MSGAAIAASVIGAGASIYGANQANKAADASNALQAGSAGMSAAEAQAAQIAQAPYAAAGYSSLVPYQMLLSGYAPDVDWDQSVDEARYQDLLAQKGQLQKDYDYYMGPASMRSNYRNVRRAQAKALEYKQKLDELADLERRRNAYTAIQNAPTQDALMRLGGYEEGWQQPFIDRSNEFYQGMLDQSQDIYDANTAELEGINPMITDYERSEQRKAADRVLAKAGLLRTNTQADRYADIESKLGEKLYGRLMDKFRLGYGLDVDQYNRSYGTQTDWLNRLYGINTDDFNRYTGVRNSELANYFNTMNLGRGAASTSSQFGMQGAGDYQSALTGAANGQLQAGMQEGYNWASLGQIPMQAVNTYAKYQNYQQPATTPQYYGYTPVDYGGGGVTQGVDMYAGDLY